MSDAAYVLALTRAMYEVALRPESLTLTLGEIERLAEDELATEQRGSPLPTVKQEQSAQTAAYRPRKAIDVTS